MKHTTEELILAATVENIARAQRNADAIKAGKNPMDEQWRRDNPMKPYVSFALAYLEDVADMITDASTQR